MSLSTSVTLAGIFFSSSRSPTRLQTGMEHCGSGGLREARVSFCSSPSSTATESNTMKYMCYKCYALRMDRTRLIKLHKPCSVFCDQHWGLPNWERRVTWVFKLYWGSSWGAGMTQRWGHSPPSNVDGVLFSCN